MNRPGHILTGISFFALCQKEGANILHSLTDRINWESFVLYHSFSAHRSFLLICILLAVTVFGSIFPDYDLKFKKLYYDPHGKKRYLYHRQITHSLLLWMSAFFYAGYTGNIYLFYFALGGISHLFGDMITGSVPVLLWGKYYNFWSRIGVDRIYKNPAFYSVFAKKLDKIMLFVAGISIGFSVI